MTRFTHCIVHAGTHKTGTTTVQNVMATRRADLAAADIHYPAINAKARDHNSLAHKLATCADAELKSARHELRGDPATLLLSAEEFSTRICNPDPWAEFDDGAYWERRKHYLSRLRSVLPDSAQIEVFICFRDHESYAHTLYATKILSGKVDWSFGEFVRRCAPIFDYRRQVEVLAEMLGPVRVKGYDELRGDLANRFFDWLDVPIQVERTPRLNPTPTLDLIQWLAQTLQTATQRHDRTRRAEFCRAYVPKPGGKDVSVDSLWPSEQVRSDFLGQCHPPPLEDWPLPVAAGRITDPAALQRRAQEIESEYRQWLRAGSHRKLWHSFWRRR